MRLSALRFVLAAGLLVMGASGCIQGGFQDVPFTVTILNDTSQPVLDHSFFGANHGAKDAKKDGRIVTVPPGGSFDESEFYNEGVDFDRITTTSGKTLGCLPFQFSKQPPKPLTVKVSQMIPCRRWPQYGSNRKDWPDPNL